MLSPVAIRLQSHTQPWWTNGRHQRKMHVWMDSFFPHLTQVLNVNLTYGRKFTVQACYAYMATFWFFIVVLTKYQNA